MTWYAHGRADLAKTAAGHPGFLHTLVGDGEWYHGSGAEFDRFDLSKDRGRNYEAKHWNSHLGAHFTSEHHTAHDLADGGWAYNGDPEGRQMVYHCSLAMQNPKHYPLESDLDREAHGWARDQGWLSRGHDSTNYDTVLRHEPQVRRIAEGFKDHLRSQGHDGITYGNEVEGTHGHLCAIAFHPDDIKIDQAHSTEDDCGEDEVCGECQKHHPANARGGCDECGHELGQDRDPYAGMSEEDRKRSEEIVKMLGSLTAHFASADPQKVEDHRTLLRDHIAEHHPELQGLPEGAWDANHRAAHTADGSGLGAYRQGQPSLLTHEHHPLIDPSQPKRQRLGMASNSLEHLRAFPHDHPNPTYVRFGDWPHDERSMNHITGQREDGVSVYDLDKDGDPMDPDHDMDRGEHYDGCGGPEHCDLWEHDPENTENHDDTAEMLRDHKDDCRRGYNRRPDRRAHLVQGKQVSFGHDDEPVIQKVERVGHWPCDVHKFVPGLEPRRPSWCDNEDHDDEEDHHTSSRLTAGRDRGWTPEPPPEGQHSYFRGLYLGRDPSPAGLEHYDSLPDWMKQTTKRPTPVPIHSDEAIRGRLRGLDHVQRKKEYDEYRAERLAETGNDMPDYEEQRQKYSLYGSHWTADHRLAHQFALDPSHGHTREPRIGGTTPLHGVVLEAQSAVEPKTNPLSSQFGETQVDFPHRSQITKVLAHIHTMDPTAPRAQRYENTHVRTIEVPEQQWRNASKAASGDNPLRFAQEWVSNTDHSAYPREHEGARVEGHRRGGPGLDQSRRGLLGLGTRLRRRRAGAGGSGVEGTGPRPLTFHPKAKKELAKFDKPTQKSIQSALEGIQSDDPTTLAQTHPLVGPLKGWNATKASRGHRIIHQPTSDGGIHVGAVSLHEYDTAIQRLTTRANRDIDDLVDLIGGNRPPKDAEPSEAEQDKAEAEYQQRIREHQEWQAKRPGINPGEDISQHPMRQSYPHAEWVPIAVAQHFREHSGDQHSGSEQNIAEIAEQLKAGRGMTDPLMLLHHNEANRASLGEGNHRLRAAEEAGWTHVPMRVCRMYDGEVERGKGKQIPEQWQGTHQGRTPEMAKPSEVLASGLAKQAATRTVTEKDGENYDGIMIALVPPKPVAESLVIEDGTESEDTLHVTLAYLGKPDEYSKEMLEDLPEIVAAWAETQPTMTARTQGAGTFVPATEDGQHVLWAAVDVPGLHRVHTDLVDTLRGRGYQPREDHSFTPHITLSYSKYHWRFLPKIASAEFAVDEVWVCIGGQWESFPLGSS